MGLAIKAISEGKTTNDVHVTDLRKGLDSNKENIQALKNGKSGEFSMVIKTVGTMLESTNISGGNVPVEQRLAGLNTIASRRVRLMDIVSRGQANSNIISWVYQANKDGAAGGTTEGSTKNQIDFDLVVANEDVVKRTAFIKVSTEMLDDIDFIESEIRNELMRELMKDVELTAYSGNGTAPQMNGIRTVATAFSAGTFAGTVDNANNVDVLVVAMNQIKIAEQGMPNYILMHPSDVTALKLYKVSGTDRRYVDRLVNVGSTLVLDGVPIIETTLITAGQYLIGDFTLATLFDKGSLRIEMGLDGNDYTKNLRTILAEYRGAMVVKNNDRTAFVKGVFSTDKASLETA
jgi:HK97 family phage major capsid protein